MAYMALTRSFVYQKIAASELVRIHAPEVEEERYGYTEGRPRTPLEPDLFPTIAHTTQDGKTKARSCGVKSTV